MFSTRYRVADIKVRPRTECELTAKAHEATEKRAARYEAHMKEAQLDPEKYSRVVPLPNHGEIDATLVGRKVEMAWAMEAKKGMEAEFPEQTKKLSPPSTPPSHKP